MVLGPQFWDTVYTTMHYNNNNNNNTKIYNARMSHIKNESEARASHQVARRSVLIANELGYEMRL